MSGSGLVGTTGGELQLIDVPQGGGGMSEQPAVWVDPAGATPFWRAAYAVDVDAGDLTHRGGLHLVVRRPGDA